MSDVGVYALAVITALLGPVQAATAHKHDEDSRLGAGEGVTRIDLYEVHLVLAGGVTARVVTSFSIAADRKRSITLHGDDGSLTLDTLWDFDSHAGHVFPFAFHLFFHWFLLHRLHLDGSRG